jgi:hypothetical protein
LLRREEKRRRMRKSGIKKRPSPRRSGERAMTNIGRLQPAEQVGGEQLRLRTDVSPCNDLSRNPIFRMLEP